MLMANGAPASQSVGVGPVMTHSSSAYGGTGRQAAVAADDVDALPVAGHFYLT